MPGAEIVLDHVAVATETWASAWPRYVEALGGEWTSGGMNIGFGPHQLRFANGARLEVLQPWAVDQNDFLRRFLDRNGPGPHHLTFKVPDIVAMIRRLEEGGFTPVAIDLRDPDWKEAFLHPKDAPGVVIQVAQASSNWLSPEPEGFPTRRPAHQASLRHVTHAVTDLQAALALFAGLLDGRVGPERDGPDGTWRCLDVTWDGPLAVRLVTPTAAAGPEHPLRTWLADRPGRVHHLALSQPDGTAGPASGVVAGVLPAEGPVEVIEPAENLGVRLVIGRPAL